MRKADFLILFCSLLFTLMFFSGCAYNNPDVYLQIASKTVCINGGEQTSVMVRVKNTGNKILSSEQNYFLSYHLLDRNGKKLIFDNIRTKIPELQPGEVKDISMRVQAPLKAGKYIIEADVVQEGVTWLKEKGNETAKGKLIVKNDAIPKYAYEMNCSFKKIKLKRNQKVEILLRIKNKGKLIWDSNGDNPVNVSYHILDLNGNIIKYDNPRFYFSKAVKRGQENEVTVSIKGDNFPQTGKYLIEFDLVQEGKTWFKEQGAKTLKLEVSIVE